VSADCDTHITEHPSQQQKPGNLVVAATTPYVLGWQDLMTTYTKSTNREGHGELKRRA
jgi:hypothetical protein